MNKSDVMKLLEDNIGDTIVCYGSGEEDKIFIKVVGGDKTTIETVKRKMSNINGWSLERIVNELGDIDVTVLLEENDMCIVYSRD